MSNDNLQFQKGEWWKVAIMILIVCAGIFWAIGPHRFKDNTNTEPPKQEVKLKAEYKPDARYFGRVTKIPAEMDMDIVIHIESTSNPNTPDSPKGARGLCQIMPKTWAECTKRMGVDWSFEVDAHDGEKSLKVGTWYLNYRIPQMIKHYNLPDNYKNRIIAYNWGIGNLRKYDAGKVTKLPKDTSDYIRDYTAMYIKKTHESQTVKTAGL